MTAENLTVYHQLARGYEAEFSAITGKKPDARIGDDVRGGRRRNSCPTRRGSRYVAGRRGQTGRRMTVSVSPWTAET